MAHEPELTEFLVAQFATFRAEYREDNKRLHDRIDNLEDVITEVKETGNRTEQQTIRTNGRVTALEGYTKSCPVKEVLEEVKQNSQDILGMKVIEKTKDSDEYKSGKWLKQAAVVAGYIVGISAVFGGLIYIKDLL